VREITDEIPSTARPLREPVRRLCRPPGTMSWHPLLATKNRLWSTVAGCRTSGGAGLSAQSQFLPDGQQLEGPVLRCRPGTQVARTEILGGRRQPPAE